MSSSRDQSPARASEQTPLLSRTDSSQDYDQANGHIESHEPTKPKRRWPIIVALSGLVVAVILAIILGFVVPSAVEEYAKEAISFETHKIAVDSFTESGVKVHVQATVWMDAAKVKKGSVRNLGRWATGWAKSVEAGEAEMKVYLPRYDDALLGSAYVPPFTLDIREGNHNFLDMVVDCEPGEPAAFRRLAQDFMEHKKEDLQVKAIVELPVKAGGFNIGVQRNTQFITISQKDAPEIPEPKLEKLKVLQHGPRNKPDGIQAWASLSVENPSPIELTVPPVTLEVLLADCHDGYDLFATTTSDELHIVPKQKLNVSATGFMSKLPTSLTSACPGSDRSPLDQFIQKFLKGDKPTIYIRGGKQSAKTPAWIGDLLRNTILPVLLPPKPAFDQSIKNFSLTGVHFSLPKTEQERPMLSATVNVLVGLPEGMNFDVNVSRVRSDGAIYYEGQAMSKLDLSEWQQASSKKANGDLLVSSKIVDAPLDIVDEDVFAKVVQKMVFEKQGVPLEIRATVDIDATTALGTFVVSGIPSRGKIFIDPPRTDGFKHEVKEISIDHTTPQSLTMKARVNVNNPTDYHSSMPHVNVSLYVNNTRMGYAWASAEIVPGDNEIISYVRWDKSKIGAEFMSQYISGYNVSLTIAQFNGSIPGLPNLGMNVTVPMPHMFGKFLKDTTIYLLSATATFVLFSPIPMWITTIHSNAYYNGTHIGTIDYEYPFVVEGGVDNETPRLPVNYEKPGGGLIRDALGGRLKIDALAHCGIKIGEWRDEIWFEGKGLGAHVRL